ncbi:MAG TPA: nucleoside triphosphate pyrophosphohydrolase [archaeon]|nr:nucleoside triphosphate pyrophosphohydrolase [archaeon]
MAKLVRDKVPEIMKLEGKNPATHIADDEEYWKRLKEKLRLEAAEFTANEKIEELASVLEVIRAICDFRKIDLKDIEALLEKKAKERGGFVKRIIIE